MSSRTFHALAGCSFGGWREDDCWPVDSFAVPLKEAVAELCRSDTSSPGAADHEGPPLADCVDKSSPGLSGTTRPLEPILEQEESTLRLPAASTSPASTWTSVTVAGAFGAGAVAGGCSTLRLPGASTSPSSTWTAAQASTDEAAIGEAQAATGKIAADEAAIAEMPGVESHSSRMGRLVLWRMS